MKIAVLFGGCSPEYSVSLQSAAAVLQNMDSSKYEAVMVGISKMGDWYSYTGPIENIKSWYYAGTSRDDCCRLKLKSYQEDTSTLTKEQFQSKLSRPSERKYIMSQILMCYSKELAQSRNNSFCCFNTYVKESAAV